MWIRDPSVGLIISRSWVKGTSSPNLSQIMTKLKYTKGALKEWNKKHFGHLHFKIFEFKQLISTLQHLSNHTLAYEDLAYRELDEFLLRGQITWKEKAKEKWLTVGMLTHFFFHISTISHCM